MIWYSKQRQAFERQLEVLRIVARLVDPSAEDQPILNIHGKEDEEWG